MKFIENLRYVVLNQIKAIDVIHIIKDNDNIIVDIESMESLTGHSDYWLVEFENGMKVPYSWLNKFQDITESLKRFGEESLEDEILFLRRNVDIEYLQDQIFNKIPDDYE